MNETEMDKSSASDTVGNARPDDTSIGLCQMCKMSVYWNEATICSGCESGLPRPLPGKFPVRLREELVQRDSLVAVRWLDGKGKVVHRGAIERRSGCKDMSRRADMCNTLASYAFKNGWAAWGLDAAARELREPEAVTSDMVTAGGYKYQKPIEDDIGPMAHWCSCDNQKHVSSGQTQLLASEVMVGMLAGRDKTMSDCQESEAHLLGREHPDRFAYERSMFVGTTPQIIADAIWLAGPGRRQIVKASGTASREIIKGARGAVETALLHCLLINNHINFLTDGLEMVLMATYPSALDHGRVRDSDFIAFAGDIARYANISRWLVTSGELHLQWPGIMDWHGGCLSTLGLVRGLQLRAWAYQSQWNVLAHYELGSGTNWEESVSGWLCIGSALGHDIGDLCSDTRRGCADNCYYAVGAHAGYEGVAACMDIVCDALEAVVMRDTRGVIEVGLIGGSACATLERTGGKLCACPMSPCEATTVLTSVCHGRRIAPADAKALVSMRNELRSRYDVLLPSTRGVAKEHMEHEEREQVYAEAIRAVGVGGRVEQAHNRLQIAYSSAARSMCGELRRRAADLRQLASLDNRDVLDLSRGCMCGGECGTW